MILLMEADLESASRLLPEATPELAEVEVLPPPTLLLGLHPFFFEVLEANPESAPGNKSKSQV